MRINPDVSARLGFSNQYNANRGLAVTGITSPVIRTAWPPSIHGMIEGRFGHLWPPIGSTYPFDDELRADVTRPVANLDAIGIDPTIVFGDLI
ncbi:MAG: hypothetical protein PGN21_08065 [Sphingomonas paucimobilis]